MDLRTRYTALVTLTTQHVKYISDALRRLEEEEVGLCFSISVLLEMEVKSLHNEKKLCKKEILLMKNYWLNKLSHFDCIL